MSRNKPKKTALKNIIKNVDPLEDEIDEFRRNMQNQINELKLNSLAKDEQEKFKHNEVNQTQNVNRDLISLINLHNKVLNCFNVEFQEDNKNLVLIETFRENENLNEADCYKKATEKLLIEIIDKTLTRTKNKIKHYNIVKIIISFDKETIRMDEIKSDLLIISMAIKDKELPLYHCCNRLDNLYSVAYKLDAEVNEKIKSEQKTLVYFLLTLITGIIVAVFVGIYIEQIKSFLHL